MSLKGSVKFVATEKSGFSKDLKSRVDAYFAEKGIGQNANVAMVIKSIVLLTLYILPFILILAYQPGFPLSLLFWFVMGFALAGIGMSVMHDANHGAYSKNKGVNWMMGHTLNLLGGSVFNWKLQHNILHHTYTNVIPLDEDIKDRLVLRFSPHTRVKAFQKYQWIYAFFFYGLLSLYWVVAKDLVQFAEFKKNGVNGNTKTQNRLTLFKIVAIKVVYLLVVLGLPIGVFHMDVSETLLGFLLMHFVAGLILTVVFQLAHTVEGTSHPLANEAGNIETEWSIHQLETTVNFSRGSWFVTWYVGGLNYQIEHHLFPKICHIHYPALAPIVKKCANDYGIEYMENKTFLDAVRSHIATLNRFGTSTEEAFSF